LNLNVILSKEIEYPKFSNDLQELQIYILVFFVCENKTFFLFQGWLFVKTFFGAV